MGEENILQIIRSIGNRFYTEEDFIKLLGKFTDDPYFWIGHLHKEIRALHGKTRSYYTSTEKFGGNFARGLLPDFILFSRHFRQIAP